MTRLEYVRTYRRETYRWRKEHHICVKCGKEDAEPHKVLCAECAAKCRANNKRYWGALDDESRQKFAQQKRVLREQLKSMGLCPRCGRKAARGKVHCVECLLKARRVSKKQHEVRRVKTNFTENTCRYCNEPVVPGKKLCAKHLEIAQHCIQIARSRTPTANHPWRLDNKIAFAKKIARNGRHRNGQNKKDLQTKYNTKQGGSTTCYSRSVSRTATLSVQRR